MRCGAAFLLLCVALDADCAVGQKRSEKEVIDGARAIAGKVNRSDSLKL